MREATARERTRSVCSSDSSIKLGLARFALFIHSVLSDLPCPRLSLVLMHPCCYGYCRRAINAVVVVNEA